MYVCAGVPGELFWSHNNQTFHKGGNPNPFLIEVLSINAMVMSAGQTLLKFDILKTV